jgi:ParB family chromosome partitioning protein
MAETNKKINMGLFGDDEIEEKEDIRHDVGNDEKAEDIKQNEEKNTDKKVVEIDVKVLNEMSKQPFKIREETNDFQRLEESIKILGIKNPLQLAKTKKGYRIIEGHRRLYIAKKLGFKTVPCLIQEEDIDRNNIQLVDGNTTHREKLLTSEMVRAYKMKYEALKNLGLLAEENKKQIAEESDKSIRTIERYLKLGNLIDDLLEYIDEYELNKQEGISRNVGLILADLNSEDQKVIYK